MKIAPLFFLVFFSLPVFLIAQEEKVEDVPYYEIPDYPANYSLHTVLARVIDGLGFRFYWATEGLTEADLNYEPGNDGRPPKDVLRHIYGLVSLTLNTVKGEPNVRPAPELNLTWEEQRIETLKNLKAASDILKSDSPPFANEMNIIFQREEKSNEFPLWNLLNGPLSDAIYHTGQIVAFRRSSGNPINPNISQFSGKVRN